MITVYTDGTHPPVHRQAQWHWNLQNTCRTGKQYTIIISSTSKHCQATNKINYRKYTQKAPVLLPHSRVHVYVYLSQCSTCTLQHSTVHTLTHWQVPLHRYHRGGAAQWQCQRHSRMWKPCPFQGQSVAGLACRMYIFDTYQSVLLHSEDEPWVWVYTYS